jgi:GNAT superfamily N-acetyltransferase
LNCQVPYPSSGLCFSRWRAREYETPARPAVWALAAQLPDGRPLGEVHWQRWPEQRLFIAGLMVDPAWRRRGVASALLDALVARHLGIRTLVANTSGRNTGEGEAFLRAWAHTRKRTILRLDEVGRTGSPAGRVRGRQVRHPAATQGEEA